MSAKTESVFKSRIVSVDYYLCEPNLHFDDFYSEFKDKEITKVPVIRVFGTTPKGVKTCLHVHRVYPYLSVPFDDYMVCGSSNSDKNNYFRKVCYELESKLNPIRVQTRNTKPNQSSNNQIYKIEEINAIPFYGFHNKSQKFMRIYFYNPAVVQKASEVLLSGAVLDHVFQPFEAHIPFILQFFINNNLYGMNFIESKRVYYRKTNESIDNINPLNIEPMSSCRIECDIDAEDIRNNDSIDVKSKRIPGLEDIWTEMINRCKDSQELNHLRGIPSQERTNAIVSEVEAYHMQKLFDGLSALNIDFNESLISSQDSGEYGSQPLDFAKLMVNCINDNNKDESVVSNDEIVENMNNESQKSMNCKNSIQPKINNSPVFTVIEEITLDSSQENSEYGSQPLDFAKTIIKCINDTNNAETSKKVENKSSVYSHIDEESNSTIIDDSELDNNQSINSFADAFTQTDETADRFGSLNDLFEHNSDEELGETVCDCDSDECCDQCCDQMSEKCECDCEKCESEKCKRIPQLDGAYDDDDSDVDSNFSPNYKEDVDDSDFEIETKKKGQKKKSTKKSQTSRASPRKSPKKGRKSFASKGSDSSDNESTHWKSTSRPGPASRKKKASDDDNSVSDIFTPSSSKKTKTSERLFDKFSPTKTVDSSPMRMSFSDGSDIDSSLANIAGTINSSFNASVKKSPKTSAKSKLTFGDDKSERSASPARSLTPYLSDEPEEEVIVDKPGPKSARLGPKSAKLGPKSAKLGPKSAKIGPKSKMGPKSSKTEPKPGPQSSKAKLGPKSAKRAGPKSRTTRNSLSSESDIFSDTNTRPQRSSARGSVTDNNRSTSPTIEDVFDAIKPKTYPWNESQLESDNEELFETNRKPVARGGPKSKRKTAYKENKTEPELEYKQFNNNGVREWVEIDVNYYDKDSIDSIGFDKLELRKIPSYIVGHHLDKYVDSIDYWNEQKSELEIELKNGSNKSKKPTLTRSKGSLKDFYTLPHLNDNTDDSYENTKSRKSKPIMSESARLITDASDILDKPLGKRSAQKGKSKAVKTETVSRKSLPKRDSPRSAGKQTETVSKKSLPKRGSSRSAGKSTETVSRKSSRSAESNSRKSSRSASRVKRGVTSSTVFTSINIPFYDSDIVSLTDLTGYRKIKYLKSVCEEFEVRADKLPNRYIKSYEKSEMSPMIFENIYYNDYNDYLRDSTSELSQAVIITMKNLVDNVAAIYGTVDSVLNDVDQEINPKPMIAPLEEDYFDASIGSPDETDWNYGHYDAEEEFEGIAEIPVGLEDHGIEPIERQNGNFSEEILEEKIIPNNSFNSDSDKDMKENNLNDTENDAKSIDGENHNNESQNGCNDLENENNSENEANSDVERNTDYEFENESNRDPNYHSNEVGIQAEELTQSSTHSNQYSNGNSNQYNDNNSPEDNQKQYQEEAEQSSDSSADCVQTNIPLNLSNLGVTHVAMHPNNDNQQFKSQAQYGSEVFSHYGLDSNPQQSYSHIPDVQTVGPPIIPQTHFQQQSVYSQQQQNWSQNIPMDLNSIPNVVPNNQTLAYNMPNVGNNQSTQQEPDFDVNSYSYMPYFPNQNIPQFDGIFDDDSFQSEGNPFNMSVKSENSIELLSQGSRSEEMSVTKSGEHIAVDIEMISENREETPLRNRLNDDIERYLRSINGVVVNIPKSIPEMCFKQIGREVLALVRLEVKQLNEHFGGLVFTNEDTKLFLKTPLCGKEKLNYLQSLCKKFEIPINRLSLNNCSSHKTFNDKLVSVPSFSNDISFHNKNFCVENENNSFQDKEIDSQKVILTDSQLSNDNNSGIYSFYSYGTQSPIHLSQNNSSVSSLDSNDVGINPLSDQMLTDINQQHSTPLDDKKCKPFFATQSSDLSQESQCQKRRQKSFQALSFNDSDDTNTNTPKNSLKTDLIDSLIEGPTLSNDFALSSVSIIDDEDLSDTDCQYLTTMSVEIHVTTRSDLRPDPNHDSIEMIFYTISNELPSNSDLPKCVTGIIAVEQNLDDFQCSQFMPTQVSHRTRIERSGFNSKDIQIDYVNDEIVMFMKFVDIVKEWDPDIIVGYELDTLSWGYVLQRANFLNMNIITPLSRINDENYCRNIESSQNRVCALAGRITINLWQIMRREITLKTYSYENVHYHVLHERIPAYEFQTLTEWYIDCDKHINRKRVIDYYLTRVRGSLRLLDKLNFVSRNSELARLFGIQFSEVYTRGTQFRVESIMLRLTKVANYLAVSPDPSQVGSMNAPESLPLILEPESGYYTDPVVVLDFQSLYPSMMIAYNYCYSTCFGRVDRLTDENDYIKFGCSELETKKYLLLKYKDDIHISPNGVVFLKDYIRKGILPKMLEQILETRIMVKSVMKQNKRRSVPNKSLDRKLDARQLGLKLISNVTYGYTNANFSGRMPCIEIADAIVSKGRETLERAIDLIHSEPKWGAKVIYGDTDSVFVLFPNCSKDEAFVRGQEIAEAVTAVNPKPVKLKFEKVYYPCILETKKRYVGFSYETIDQIEPKFDAKGIETVRRDTCPAVSKMLEKSLRILFNTNDVNGVKLYCLRQFHKILEAKVSIFNDFVFAREYRGKDNYSVRSHVPSAEIAKKRLNHDIRSEPKIDERVPYIVIYGSPDEQLYKLVREPLELIKDPSLRLNSNYYIERVIIPALNRAFQMMGCDVNKWFREMPRKTHRNRYQYLLGQESRARTIPQYYNTTSCAVCFENTKSKGLCETCGESRQSGVVHIHEKIDSLQKKHRNITNICNTCTGGSDDKHVCVSIDCPNLFRFHESKLDYMNVKYLNQCLKKI